MSNAKENRLFAEFPPISREEWEAVVQKDLKGADYQKKLVWKTHEGIDVKPYYRKEDVSGLEFLQSVPGEFPYVRGSFHKGQNWLNRQDIFVDSVKKAAGKAKEAIEKGAGSVAFILPGNKKFTVQDIAALTENLCLDTTEVNFIAGENAAEVLEHFLTHANGRADKNLVKASVDFDPVGWLTITGNFYESRKDSFATAKSLVEKSSVWPNVKVLTVSGQYFQNAGSSLVQELGFSLAIGNEYIQELTSRGLNAGQVCARLKFSFATGTNYFMEIAKIRAARLLWAKLAEAWGCSHEEAYMNIHSTTARFNKSVYDPYTNMLRTTTESMSAILGGADSVTTEPFDTVFREESTGIAERIARNTQIVLKEEAYLGKIKDPASGSWYIESLTASIAEEAWKLFLQLQEKGGYVEAFKQGFVQEKVAAIAKVRMNQIAARGETILGLNQFPNLLEKVAGSVDRNVLEKKQNISSKPLAAPLQLVRGSEDLEKLRLRTERHSKTPLVFLLTYGNVTMRRARAGFASNFFGCAGFSVTDNIGFDGVEEGMKAAAEAKADIVVLCSSDEEYPEGASGAAGKMKDGQLLVVAGYPKETVDQLKQAGVKHFIHMRANLLETLGAIQDELGMK